MSEEEIYGSCLCGVINYVVTGETKRFYKCHCKRCQKATGSGFSSALLIAPKTSITWLSGESFLVRYKTPEPNEYYNRFCLQCGSSMPLVMPELDAVLVPVGSLDTEEGGGYSILGSRADSLCVHEHLDCVEN